MPGPCWRRSAADLLERTHRSLLLGGSTAAPAPCSPHRQLRNHALYFEVLLVRRSSGRQHGILRQGNSSRLEQLLQERLGVLSERLWVETRKQRFVQTQDSFARRSETTVEEDRPHEGLESVSQDGWASGSAAFDLTLSQLQILAQAECLRDSVECPLPYQVCAQP